MSRFSKWRASMAALLLMLGGANTQAASSAVTVGAQTNLLAGSLTASNLTANTIVAANSAKQLVSATNTGSGSVVLQTSPTLITPALGVATATTINKVAITAPASGATITIPDGATVTMQGTDTYVGRATTDTLTGKTLDAAGTGNVLKFTDYRDFVFPSRVDGAGATMVTNDYSSALWGLATFSGTADTNGNYAVFRIGTVPYDLDTAAAVTLKGLSIRVAGTDADAAEFTVALFSPASSSSYSPSDFTAFSTFIHFDSGALTSPAANDIFYFADVTLTGWGAALTAGRPWIIGIARRNGSNDDAVTIVSGTIEYGRTK